MRNEILGLAAFRRLIATPQVAALVTASLLARMPLSMGAVGLVIFVHARTGSFGVAGLVAGGFSLGCALAGPLLGRLVDRRGPRQVMLRACICSSAAMIAVVALGENGATGGVLVATAALSGCTMPPISGLLRPTWPSLVEPDELLTAYLFDSMLIEVVFVGGPLLASLLAATAGPGSALIFGAGLGLLGTLWLLAVPAIRDSEPAPPEHHTRAGALASPAIRLLIVLGVPFGLTFGALDVALPAFGASHGSTALGGVFTAALGLGALIGAILYSAVPGLLGDLRQSCFRLTVAQPFLLLPLLLAPSIGAMVALAVLAGSYVAPMVTVRNRIGQIVMPAGTGTEAFTWLLLAIVGGASVGSALAGPLIEAGGWRLGIVLAIVVSLAGPPIIVAERRLLPRG